MLRNNFLSHIFELFSNDCFFNDDNFINRIIHLNRTHINVNYIKKYSFIKIEMNKYLLIKNEHEILIDEKFCDSAKFYKN